MSVLMRCSEITKRPVVTMAGEAVAQIKDVVYAADGGEVAGFTLAGLGVFSGPLDQGLPWDSVAALGADAVMIVDETALAPLQGVLDHAATSARGSSRSDVLSAEVLTDTGTALGTVVDVIVDVGSRRCEVTGYEVESSSEALGHKGTKVLVPLPDTLAASGEHLMVPASATGFVRDDLAGFGAAVEAFRAQLKGAH